MVTVAEVRCWDPHALDSAARALHATREEVEGLRARLRAARPGENGWRGPAHCLAVGEGGDGRRSSPA